MFYKASDIIKRSLQLADLSNTDFLTHKEITQYLNDAWSTVFQWVINKGDKQFIREVELMNCQGFSDYVEYDLPDDLFQICSIRNKYSGSLVPRRAESEGVTSNTYEVINDKLRLYGVSSQQLVLTYWAAPVYITFPDKDVVTDLQYSYSPNGHFLSRCKNTVLTSDGIIYNMLTGETYGNIDIDTSSYSYLLGPGYVMAYASGSSTYYDFDGNEITETLGDPRASNLNAFYDEEGRLYTSLVFDNYNINTSYTAGPGTIGITLSWIRTTGGFSYVPLAKYKDYILAGTTDGKNISVYDLEGNLLKKLPVSVTLSNPGCYYNVVSTDNGFGFVADGGVYYHVYIDDNGVIEVSTDKSETYFLLSYGPVTSDYKNFIVKSGEEDTMLNFPNDIYYSLLAVDLALRYVMKQNADSTGLDNLYRNYQTTFMNMLSQDAGYSRISNIYQ